jgi:hypothetical protein
MLSSGLAQAVSILGVESHGGDALAPLAHRRLLMRVVAAAAAEGELWTFPLHGAALSPHTVVDWEEELAATVLWSSSMHADPRVVWYRMELVQ